MASASSTASCCGEGTPASEQTCKSSPEAPDCRLESRHQGCLPLLHLPEVAIQLRETEGPVDLRTGELQPVFREQNALLLAGRTAKLVANIDALLL
jgi:hypothetical protein